jgi:hypothetical protein
MPEPVTFTDPGHATFLAMCCYNGTYSDWPLEVDRRIRSEITRRASAGNQTFMELRRILGEQMHAAIRERIER